MVHILEELVERLERRRRRLLAAEDRDLPRRLRQDRGHRRVEPHREPLRAREAGGAVPPGPVGAGGAPGRGESEPGERRHAGAAVGIVSKHIYPVLFLVEKKYQFLQVQIRLKIKK